MLSGNVRAPQRQDLQQRGRRRAQRQRHVRRVRPDRQGRVRRGEVSPPAPAVGYDVAPSGGSVLARLDCPWRCLSESIATVEAPGGADVGTTSSLGGRHDQRRQRDRRCHRTKDKDYNLIWFTEACLSNALRLETYIQDAERDGDNELADLFRRAQGRAARGPSQASNYSPAGSAAEPVVGDGCGDCLA